jgi:hypothetical protein
VAFGLYGGGGGRPLMIVVSDASRRFHCVSCEGERRQGGRESLFVCIKSFITEFIRHCMGSTWAGRVLNSAFMATIHYQLFIDTEKSKIMKK